jgi:hypothetical protein
MGRKPKGKKSKQQQKKGKPACFDFDEEGWDDPSGKNWDALPEEGWEKLPAVVTLELERRKENKASEEDPPNEAAIRALRKHFTPDDGKPFNIGCGHRHGTITRNPAKDHGSFVSLLRKLGATPRSDDPLVKNRDTNLVSGERGPDSKLRAGTREWWWSRFEQHEAEVRLLRYGELVESQEQAGIRLPSECHFMEWGCQAWNGFPENESDAGDDSEDGRDDDAGAEDEGGGDADDEGITDEHLASLTNAFSNGFFLYANHDRILRGVAHGVTPVPPERYEALSGVKVSEGSRFYEFDVCVETLSNQCVEIENEYLSQGRPLGPPPEARMSKSHADMVQQHLQKLLLTLEQILRPSMDTARMISNIACMLSAATKNDPEVARCLANGNSAGAVLRLRQAALKLAIAADADVSRSVLAGDSWWLAFGRLTEVLGDVVVSLGDRESFSEGRGPGVPSKDGLLSTQLFKGFLLPALLKSLKSTLSAERAPSFATLDAVSLNVPLDSLVGIVESKKTWGWIATACRGYTDEQANVSSKARKRETRAAPIAAEEACLFLTKLCGRGMALDDSYSARSSVVPELIACKLTERGVVPLFMELARSSVHRISQAAMEGLSQVSRVKDCRTLLLQHNGIGLIRDTLVCPNGNVVSAAMLLIVHLFMDSEWSELLMSIDPPIERLATQWAVFSMACIRNRAAGIRHDLEARLDMHEEGLLQIPASTMLDQNALTQALAKMQEELDQIDSEEKWWELEKQFDASDNKMLRRSLILLNAMFNSEGGPNRLLKVNVLALVAACLDAPLRDVFMASITIAKNFILMTPSGRNGQAWLHSQLRDPSHFVHALASRAVVVVRPEIMAGRKPSSQGVVVMSLLALLQKDHVWKPYFEAMIERDSEVGQFLGTIPNWMGQPVALAFGTHAKDDQDQSTGCFAPTGLKKCHECGKMEGRRGESAFKRCSRCLVAIYCGKECQRKAWKNHKEDCVSA